MKKEVENEKVDKFLGFDLITSAKYSKYRDYLNTVLDADTYYSLDEVDKIIDNFTKVKG